MKKTIVLLALLSGLIATQSKAQIFDEWFRQKKTQIKYYTQQIAALQTYLVYVKQGYKIADKGISTIRDIKNGEFGLHTAYFTSLRTVNPAIKNNPQVQEILDRQAEILARLDKLQSATGLTSDEKSYVGKVRSAVLKACDQDLQDLEIALTNGEAEMTDDERIQRVQQVYAATLDKYQFSASFSASVQAITGGKIQVQKDIGLSKMLYGIHP